MIFLGFLCEIASLAGLVALVSSIVLRAKLTRRERTVMLVGGIAALAVFSALALLILL